MRQENRYKKLNWVQPKLIELTRGNKEEGVLAACKAMPPHNMGPSYWQYGCAYDAGYCVACAEQPYS